MEPLKRLIIRLVFNLLTVPFLLVLAPGAALASKLPLETSENICSPAHLEKLRSIKLNIPGEKINKIISQDFCFLGQLRGTGATPLYQQIFGGSVLDGDKLLDWARSRINKISEGKAPLAVVYVEDEKPNEMFVTIFHFFNLGGPQKLRTRIQRIASMIHEARHLTPISRDRENKRGVEVDHIACSSNQYDDYRRCDNSIHGAWAAQLVLLGNIAKHCTSCDAQTIEEAKVEMINILKHNFLLEPALSEVRRDLEI